MNRLAELLRELKNHVGETYNTLDKGSTGKNIRHDANALAKTLKSSFPMLEKDPQYVGTEDLINSGFGVMPLTFIGKTAKTWDEKAAKKAAALLKRGVDPEKVWQRHMTGQMPDGALFQEIDDSAANMMPFNDEIVSHKPHQIMQHQALYDSYPELNKISVSKSKYGGTYYAPELDSIKLSNVKQKMINQGNYDAEFAAIENQAKELDSKGLLTLEKENELQKLVDALDNRYSQNPQYGEFADKSDFLHELQHAIQEREGWARGGNPDRLGLPREEQFLQAKKAYEDSKFGSESGISSDDLYAELTGLSKNIKPKKTWDELTDREKLFWLESGRDRAYRRLTGEAQARATQERMGMDMAERRANYPLKNNKLADVLLGDLIYKYK